MIQDRDIVSVEHIMYQSVSQKC